MIDLDHLRQWIGRSETRSELLTPAAVERFNATFDIKAEAMDGEHHIETVWGRGYVLRDPAPEMEMRRVAGA